MAASPALPLLFSLIFSSYKSLPPPFSVSYCSPHSRIRESMFLLVFFFTLSLLSISILVFSLYSKRRSRHHHHRHHGQEKQETQKTITCVNSENATSPSETSVDNENNTHTDVQNISGSDPNVLSHSILLEILPSDSPGWAELFRDDDASGKKQPYLEGDPAGNEEEEERKKKRKKRGKKKRPDPNGCGEDEGKKEKKEELVCLYPFTTSTSATQRKIKQQYDQLVKSHESNSLTLAQVGQFVNCLVESKKELQHRSEVIQRKFTITKALLLKADRSSFNRLRQQIYKLELEQKRLEEDAFVYNWLQQQLKLSPAYKKVLEIGSCMEMKAESCEQAEGIESEVDDISFEELLAQEKKDAFWQRNGKSKS